MAKKQTKKQQAMMQSDNIEMEGFSEGITYGGDFDSAFSYSFGDLGQLDLFSEEDMKEKYPALKQAYEHYQNIKQMCETREKEEDEN